MLRHGKINGALPGIIQGSFAKSFQGGGAWIKKRPVIGSVDLGVAVEMEEDIFQSPRQ